jgi:hypothetical protein
MFEDNVIWVDFRLSKDIRSKQELSFAERMKAHSERTRSHIQASKTALETIKQMLGEERSGGNGPHLSGKS